MSPAMQHFVSQHFAGILLFAAVLLYMLVHGKLSLKALLLLAAMVVAGSYFGLGGGAGKALGGVSKTGDMTERDYETCLYDAVKSMNEGAISRQMCGSETTQTGWDACMARVLCSQGSDGGDAGCAVAQQCRQKYKVISPMANMWKGFVCSFLPFFQMCKT